MSSLQVVDCAQYIVLATVLKITHSINLQFNSSLNENQKKEILFQSQYYRLLECFFSQ